MKNSFVNSVLVDDWTAEWTTNASNVNKILFCEMFHIFIIGKYSRFYKTILVKNIRRSYDLICFYPLGF